MPAIIANIHVLILLTIRLHYDHNCTAEELFFTGCQESKAQRNFFFWSNAAKENAMIIQWRRAGVRGGGAGGGGLKISSCASSKIPFQRVLNVTRFVDFSVETIVIVQNSSANL